MGETLTRTFTMDTSASRLQSKLDFDVDGIETGNPTDVTHVDLPVQVKNQGTTAQSARPLCGGPFRRFPLEGDAK